MRNSDIMEMVDELLDSEGDVVIGSLTFSRSEIVKRLDPIAYREICNDVVSSQIDDLQYDLDRLDPELDADEIADIKERIEDLEGAF
jgi:sugar-specific transcriptional regulator TrmB